MAYPYQGKPWQYAAASGGIVDTADNAIQAASTAGQRHYLRSMQVVNNDASVGTELVIKDGSTVIFRIFVPQSIALVTQPMPVGFEFDPPLFGSVNTALNVAAITTSAQLYVNAQGFSQ